MNQVNEVEFNLTFNFLNRLITWYWSIMNWYDLRLDWIRVNWSDPRQFFVCSSGSGCSSSASRSGRNTATPNPLQRSRVKSSKFTVDAHAVTELPLLLLLLISFFFTQPQRTHHYIHLIIIITIKFNWF